MKQFSDQVLDPLIGEADAFFRSGKLLPGVTIDEFMNLIGPLVKRARAGFLNLLGVDTTEKVESTLWVRMVGYIISGFNSVLPNNHPLVVGYVLAKEERNGVFIVISRSKIPLWYDILHCNIFPVFEAENMEAVHRSDVKFFHVFLPPDEDEPNPEPELDTKN